MRTEEVQETIDVGVSFKKGMKPVPRWFVWNGKKVDVKSVENTWKSRHGDSPLLFFAVTDGTNVFEISLNQKSLTWVLEKVHVEG